MKRKLFLPGALAAVVAVAVSACGDSSTSPGAETQPGLSAAEAESLAADFDAVGAAVIDGIFAAPLFSTSGEEAAAVTVDETFTRTRACPRGGSVTVTGRTTGTADRQTRSATRLTEATRTEQGCAFEVRGGAVLTLNGNPSTTLRAEQSVTNGTPGKRTLSQKGSFTWARSTGQSGTCAVDITSSFDPATRTHTVNGTFCNRTVSITHTRS